MKTHISLFALAVLLFALAACSSMGTQDEQPEVGHFYRLKFLTPDSMPGENGAQIDELEELLIQYVNPTRMVSTQTRDEIAVDVHFADKHSWEGALQLTGVAIKMFSSAHPDILYYDPPCSGQNAD